MSREVTRSTPKAGGPPPPHTLGSSSPFPDPNRSRGRAAPAENPRPAGSGAEHAWVGSGCTTRGEHSRQSSPPSPPGYVPHPPTQPISFSYPLPQEFKFLAGAWMGILLLVWQSRGWGGGGAVSPILGLLGGHGQHRGKPGFPGERRPDRLLSLQK